MKDKKKTKGEYIIIILVIGLINFGLMLINQAIQDIYRIYQPHFLIYWGIMISLSFIAGFFYIAVWIIIKDYFTMLPRGVKKDGI